jgi:hypothetical protein
VVTSGNRQPVRFLVLSASLRGGSLNKRLAQLAADTIATNGGEADLASMDEFAAVSYDQDVQNDEGFPAPIEVMSAVVFLPHAGEDEHLVVHREPEQEGERDETRIAEP